MGDLSGGQVLKKVARRALKLPSTGEGLNFYQFEEIHSQKSFKQLYRSRMNELELDLETKQRIVDESNKAFGFNMMVSHRNTEEKDRGQKITEQRQLFSDEVDQLFILKQVFTELEEIGKTIKEEVQDAGFGHSHAEIMQGSDISKCPYYAAKMGNDNHTKILLLNDLNVCFSFIEYIILLM